MAQHTTASHMNLKRKHIEIGEDAHLRVDEIPYEAEGNLGFGGHGFVEKVRDVHTGRCYARKTFRLDRGRLEQAQKMLRHEVQIIRELAPHPHIIRVHATYIAGRTLAVILEPVASYGNLAEYMTHIRDLKHAPKLIEEGRKDLLRGFGCLANCLDYLHSDRYCNKPVIRHKDIKPSNILVHDGSLIFTDFGISNRCDDGATTTAGRPDVFTLRYCAPEVADYDNRGRKADVFSLGCVFLEMIEALEPHFELRELLRAPGDPYYQNTQEIRARLSLLNKHSYIDKITCEMLFDDPSDRPPAEEVAAILQTRAALPSCEYCELFASHHSFNHNSLRTDSKGGHHMVALLPLRKRRRSTELIVDISGTYHSRETSVMGGFASSSTSASKPLGIGIKAFKDLPDSPLKESVDEETLEETLEANAEKDPSPVERVVMSYRRADGTQRSRAVYDSDRTVSLWGR